MAPPDVARRAAGAADPLRRAVDALDLEAVTLAYREQGELVALPRWLPPEVLDPVVAEARALLPRAQRSYLPFHKKGGSLSAYALRDRAPSVHALYRSPALLELVATLAGTPLGLCPDDDPHACALYCYTEPGDHVGWHYDTSYYRGARYTVLIGLVDRSDSRLECQLHTREPGRAVVDLALRTEPGTLVAFHGDLVRHRITPLGRGMERVVLSLEYVADPTMGRFQRFVSNMKDAIAYFGFRAVWRGRRHRPA